MSTIEQQCANAIRFLSIDAVQKANSGHPGAPMGMADIAYVLWKKHLSHNPTNPKWANRDRFILSNGHASMLLYSLLHLSGYNLSIEDLKNFRQMHAKTAGHPELGYADGIETTTGPLGQGISNAVGFALAEKLLSNQFNRETLSIVDHYTYTFLGDGCLMEGISHEACSLAGTLKLHKLIAFYDDNGISIDGKVEGWFTDNTAERFQSYGWNVIDQVDGHNLDAIDNAIQQAKNHTNAPTLIICKTIIGKGAPHKEGSESTHGSPLGQEEIDATRKNLHWDYAPFEIPQEIYQAWDAKKEGAHKEQSWDQIFNEYAQKHPDLAKEFIRRMQGKLPENFTDIALKAITEANQNAETLATRVASKKALDALAMSLPEIIGGSADLTPSNNTFFKGSQEYSIDTGSGNYLHFGVREFGMAAILNGLALHGGFIPYGATFLVFSDYARNAIRMSALMKQRVIYVMTHDSIGLGEDGPTHQPIEHVQSLRLIPNLDVWRPCDAVETMVAWNAAITSNDRPSLLALSRQNLPHQARTEQQIMQISKGGYILKDNTEPLKLTIIATGSEVALAIAAAKELGENVRVVSMPCVDRFKEQEQQYKKEVLGNAKTMAIEAGSTSGWYEFADDVIGIDEFGASAPANELFKHYNFTVEHVVKRAKLLISQ